MTSNWRDRCHRKLTSLKKAIDLIRRGDHIHLSDGSATPLGIIPGLVSNDANLGDNEILHLLTLGEAPYVRTEFADKFRHNALFIGPNVREAVEAGRADYTPVFLSEIPALIRSGRIPIDVSIVSVSPPDAEGYCTFGTHVDINPAATSVARLVIAQVNPKMPRTFGPSRIHVDQIHAMVEAEHPLPELKPPQSRPETEAIARAIAELVPDGATLQLGIGGIPDAVLRFLKDRNDLGIHTEMFSDGVVALARAGVVTGKRKTLHPGKIIASFLLGTQGTYDFVHENPFVELYPVDYSNDPFVIAQNDDMIAINTCLEIDLTGQVCSDSIGTRFYSGIGGQVDFIRGAARSERGKPIIALPSTARGGTVSRIVPRLDEGAGVVTTRGDVHFVVTEFGVANLHGKNIRQRAMALISIAHPKFRPWLLAEAKQRHFVYSDQIEPPMHVPLYPRQLEIPFQSRDGLGILIRPIKPTDEEKLHDMFYRFSRETIYQRFFAVKKTLPRKSLQEFCTIDYDTDMTLVASIRKREAETIVGMALYAFDARTGFAEAACVVADEYQGHGIGTRLMQQIQAVAEAREVKGFTAEVLTSNLRMIRVFEKCGYPVVSRSNGDTISLRIPFEKQLNKHWHDRNAGGLKPAAI
jgi:acyl-CoA hydrolase/RimJ/RimL family protein N-acetyltransferase